MSDTRADVEAFHRAMGSTIGETAGFRDNDLRSILVDEETREMHRAWAECEAYEDADMHVPIEALARLAQEVCDLIYVLQGSLIAWGIPDAVWDEVQRANMAKVGPDGVVRRPDGKVMKPSGWTPADVLGVLSK